MQSKSNFVRYFYNWNNHRTIHATYNFNTGEICIPKLSVVDLFGTEHFYEVYLKQKDKTLDFSVDV